MTIPPTTSTTDENTPWIWAIVLVAVATAVRLVWVLSVPTVPVGDFAMYRESANYLSEFGRLDPGFIYMPGFVFLLALVKDLGGDLLAQKLIGVFFGGLAAAAIFGVSFHLGGRDRRRAIVATVAYALWPAGIAMSSVVGTDVPAAALMLTALACLCAWGRARPWRAALAFGVVMGLAAYVRAVALPLAAMSLFYWLAQRRGVAAFKLTLVSVAATLVMLSPWALRNKHHDGELFFTDTHGGITALIGANPNSQGTYTRALNQLFHEVTGRAVLDQPHRAVDRDAYALAVEWTRFQPRYALGLAIKRAGRLFDFERRLLYWPVYRPGVLLPPHSTWFEARRAALHRLADTFSCGLVALFLLGVGLALAERRLPLLTLLPLQAALAATYILFFAEPRYRLPIEMMAFPVAAHALVGLWRLATAALVGERRALRVGGAGLALGGVLVAAAFVTAPALLDQGDALRLRHRWAVALWTVDGQPRVSLWRRDDVAHPGQSAHPSPLEGALDGVRLRLRADRDAVAAAAVTVSGAPLSAGVYRLTADIQVVPSLVDETALLTVGTPDSAITSKRLAADSPPKLTALFSHGGGPLRLQAAVQRLPTVPPQPNQPAPATDLLVRDVWLNAVTVARISEDGAQGLGPTTRDINR